jgi:hypothetical protein
MLGLGQILYVALLLVNAVAILNEERFLSRSQSIHNLLVISHATSLTIPPKVGWSTQHPYHQQSFVDPGFGGGQDGPGVKARMINLISAVRTLMRSEHHLFRPGICTSQLTRIRLPVPLIVVNTGKPQLRSFQTAPFCSKAPTHPYSRDRLRINPRLRASIPEIAAALLLHFEALGPHSVAHPPSRTRQQVDLSLLSIVRLYL